MKVISIVVLIAICVQCALSAKTTLKSRSSRGKSNTNAENTIIDPEESTSLETEEQSASPPTCSTKAIPPTANKQTRKRQTLKKKRSSTDSNLTTSKTKGATNTSTTDSIITAAEGKKNSIERDDQVIIPNEGKNIKKSTLHSTIEGDSENGNIKYGGKVTFYKDKLLKGGTVTIRIVGKNIFINYHLISNELPLKSDASYFHTFMNPPKGISGQQYKFNIQISKDGKVRFSDNAGNNEELKIYPTADNEEVKTVEEENEAKNVACKSKIIIIECDGKTGNIKRNGEVIVQNNDFLITKGAMTLRIVGKYLYINHNYISGELPLNCNVNYFRTFTNPPEKTGKPAKFTLQIRSDGKVRYSDNLGNIEFLKVDPDSNDEEEKENTIYG